MKGKTKTSAIILALLAAVFYAINTPFSKILLGNVPPTFLAAFLYLGAGVGVGMMYLFQIKKEDKSERLTKQDLLYTVGMILLDIVAPIFLMIGIKMGTASNASLLGNFEIVATTLIALLIFKEKVSGKLWIAIGFITLSSIVLSFEGIGSLQCTRKISEKSTYQIVLLKGIFSGGGAFVIAVLLGEKIPEMKYIVMIMLLGYVSYGLSIFLYIRAQRNLGAAKTSAYYAVAPFVGSFLAFAVNGEKLAVEYFVGLALMFIGTVFVVYDTMIKNHLHGHMHTIVHTHNGVTHTHLITHTHEHYHFGNEEFHHHEHEDFINSHEHKLAHENGV